MDPTALPPEAPTCRSPDRALKPLFNERLVSLAHELLAQSHPDALTVLLFPLFHPLLRAHAPVVAAALHARGVLPPALLNAKLVLVNRRPARRDRRGERAVGAYRLRVSSLALPHCRRAATTRRTHQQLDAWFVFGKRRSGRTGTVLDAAMSAAIFSRPSSLLPRMTAARCRGEVGDKRADSKRQQRSACAATPPGTRAMPHKGRARKKLVSQVRAEDFSRSNTWPTNLQVPLDDALRFRHRAHGDRQRTGGECALLSLSSPDFFVCLFFPTSFLSFLCDRHNTLGAPPYVATLVASSSRRQR